jgi:hypothetical protein
MPTSNNPAPQKLLTAVTSTGASSWVDVSTATEWTILTEASSVTTGGTMLIEAKDSAGTAVTIDSTAIAADGDTWITSSVPIVAVRSNLSARTDGTYTTTLYMRVG